MTRTNALLVVGCIMLALAILAALELRQEVTEPAGQVVTGVINSTAPPAQTLAEAPMVAIPQKTGALVPLDQGTLRPEEYRPAVLPDQPSANQASANQPAPAEPVQVQAEPTKPVLTEPAAIKPIVAELAKVEPAKIEPTKVEPAKIEPAKIEPVQPKPVSSAVTTAAEPAKSEPAKSEPAKSEPAKSESAKPESAKPESAKPESAKPESAKPESAKPESAKSEPAKSEPAKPEPVKSEQAEKTGKNGKAPAMRAIDTAGPLNVEKGQKTIIWTRLELANKSVIFRLSGAEKVEGKAFALPDPDRYVIDLQGDWAMRLPEVPNNAFVKKIRVGKYGENTRMVLDLSGTRSCQMVRISPTTLEFRIR